MIWCVCGHEYDDHSSLIDSETGNVEETWCQGIDSNHRNEIKADPDTKTMILSITCPCREFSPAAASTQKK